MFTLRNPSAIVLQREANNKDDAQGTFCLSFLVEKLHGKHAVEHLSVTAGWPVISLIKSLSTQLRQIDGGKAGRHTGP